jgi:uncharacterized iron-regulated protein
MKKSYLFIALLIAPLVFTGQHKHAYQVFDKNGNVVNYGQMLESSSSKMLVLFGELHNNPIAHWLQLELTSDLYLKTSGNLQLGAEMFEADNQLILDEYVSGKISERNFLNQARLWNNYQTDYRPLVNFAASNNIPFFATNIPRRYASIVHQKGFDALEQLDEKARQYIAPLPVAYDPDLPAYRAMLEMPGIPAHSGENLPKAQAIKDATMAHFIYKNINREGIFLHFHGAYHSDNFEGIVWYIRELDEKLPLLTISTVEQAQVDSLDEGNLGKADFIIAVPATMTKTY